MKVKILMIALLFVLMAAVPMFLMMKNQPPTESHPAEQAPSPTDKSSSAVKTAAALCDNSFNDEAVKAVTILARTNALIKPTADSNNNSDKELLRRVESIYNSNKEILTYQNKTVYIPCAKCSKGVTERDDKYDYLIPVASPWDCESNFYQADASCQGVSLNGIKYLCANGSSAEEALKWYLPKLEIG